MKNTAITIPAKVRLERGNRIRASLKRNRIWEVDFLRGLFFLTVFIYHLAWDFTMLPFVFYNFYDLASPGFVNLVTICEEILGRDGMEWAVRFFSGTFLFITGVCCSLSHDNFLRGLKLFAWGEVLTLVTVGIVLFGQTNELIVFGILHCIGFCVAIYGLFQKLERKLNFKISPWVYIILGLIIWAVGYYFIYGLRADSYDAGNMVSFDEMSVGNILQIIVGTKYSYGDSFPLFPNAGKILVGIGVGLLVYGPKRGKRSLCPRADGWWFAPIEFIGRHSLLLYLGEQVLAWVVFVAVMLPLGYTLGF